MVTKSVAVLALLGFCFQGVSSTKFLFERNHTSEVFVFSTNSSNWKFYDWTKITTIVEFGYHDDALVKFAHRNKVLVSYAANFDRMLLYNNSAIEHWISDQMKFLVTNDLDGINIDFEDEINCSDILARNSFVQLMELLKLYLKKYKTYAQLSIDFAWSPFNIDNRCYDYQAIAAPADLVFVMAYDERSQIFGPCIAGANSPYFNAIKGVKSFNDIGIPLNKIVLGVPWYGYDYDCIKFHPETNICFMREVPFRGVPCSDAAGTQIGFSLIMTMVNSSLSWPLWGSGKTHHIKIISKAWDESSDSPYLTYLDLDKDVYHQIWYDDYISLSLKYSFSRSYGLAGIGFWNADSVEYSGSEIENLAGKDMWDAIPPRNKVDGSF